MYIYFIMPPKKKSTKAKATAKAKASNKNKTNINIHINSHNKGKKSRSSGHKQPQGHGSVVVAPTIVNQPPMITPTISQPIQQPTNNPVIVYPPTAPSSQPVAKPSPPPAFNANDVFSAPAFNNPVYNEAKPSAHADNSILSSIFEEDDDPILVPPKPTVVIKTEPIPVHTPKHEEFKHDFQTYRNPQNNSSSFLNAFDNMHVSGNSSTINNSNYMPHVLPSNNPVQDISSNEVYGPSLFQVDDQIVTPEAHANPNLLFHADNNEMTPMETTSTINQQNSPSIDTIGGYTLSQLRSSVFTRANILEMLKSKLPDYNDEDKATKEQLINSLFLVNGRSTSYSPPLKNSTKFILPDRVKYLYAVQRVNDRRNNVQPDITYSAMQPKKSQDISIYNSPTREEIDIWKKEALNIDKDIEALKRKYLFKKETSTEDEQKRQERINNIIEETKAKNAQLTPNSKFASHQRYNKAVKLANDKYKAIENNPQPTSLILYEAPKPATIRMWNTAIDNKNNELALQRFHDSGNYNQLQPYVSRYIKGKEEPNQIQRFQSGEATSEPRWDVD